MQVRIQCAVFTFLVHATSDGTAGSAITVAAAIVIVRPPLASYQRPVPGGPPSSDDSLDEDDGGCGPGGPGSCWSNWLSSGVPCPRDGRCGIALATCRSYGGAADASHPSDGAGSVSTEPQSIGASITTIQPTAGRWKGRYKLHTRVAYMTTE